MMFYSDRLLRALVVVERRGEWWLVPRAPDGWQRRTRLTMSAEARRERLRPIFDIDGSQLGIPAAIAAGDAGGQELLLGT